MMYITTNGWTKQKMIDHVKANFKGKSIGDGSNGIYTCLYRGPDGKKCAVGMFIPDTLYTSEMEGFSYTLLKRSYPEIDPFMPLACEGMCYLQATHDSAMSGDAVLRNMLQWIEVNVGDLGTNE